MFAGVGCGEGELAIGAATLRDDTVIIVEEFIDGYVDALGRGQRLWETMRDGDGRTMSGLGWYDRELWSYCVALKWPGWCLSVYRRSSSCIAQLTNYQGVLGQFLEEALLGRAIDVEVERLGAAQEEGDRAEYRPHGGGDGGACRDSCVAESAMQCLSLRSGHASHIAGVSAVQGSVPSH